MTFLNKNFLLTTKTAKKLYHKVASSLPIIDYHCHLSVEDIAENRQFKTITELWLEGDHYKWRAMRSNGIAEKRITGNADDFDKFLAWAETVPYCIGNPLYHWTHLELRRSFGIKQLLSSETALDIYNRCNALLSTKKYSVRSLILSSNVESLCTTDDPCDDLEQHKKLATHWSAVKVLPTFRPDKYIDAMKEGFNSSIKLLEKVTSVLIVDYSTLLKALVSRLDYFHNANCRLSDHGLDSFDYIKKDKSTLDKVVKNILDGKIVEKTDAIALKSELLTALGVEYRKRKWVMQLHIGALRNNSSVKFSSIGLDSGFDSIDDKPIARPLSLLLNSIEENGGLSKTIIYCLNASDNDVIATMIGNFQGEIAGKIQFGSSWWFNDQKDGILSQLNSLASLGLITRFVGMLTDSRSFISYSRHEYFRRILCSLFGDWVENGEIPDDWDNNSKIVKNICYLNAKDYF